ncbi:MAG: hypothetical protein PVF17_01580 [Ignavibacteria bacterium]|jgi:hypothetical protein
MKLNYWKPAMASGKVKLTVHKNGNMGFSNPAVAKMQIDETSYMKIATNAEDPRDNNLYLILSVENDENSLKVNKAGNYYYLNTKSFFNEKNIDYKKKKLIYDVVEINYEGSTIYKLIKREIERKKNRG